VSEGGLEGTESLITPLRIRPVCASRPWRRRCSIAPHRHDAAPRARVPDEVSHAARSYAGIYFYFGHGASCVIDRPSTPDSTTPLVSGEEAMGA
jgi:hypothetical protein